MRAMVTAQVVGTLFPRGVSRSRTLVPESLRTSLLMRWVTLVTLSISW